MWRYPAMLMGAFAAIALLMAVIGTYGLVAYGVSLRLHEIGVRVALGARPADILRLVMGRSLALALSGIAVGLGSAAVLTRGLQKLLFGVKALDSATFGVVAAVLVASFIPARRASQVPPGVAMGGEYEGSVIGSKSRPPCRRLDPLKASPQAKLPAPQGGRAASKEASGKLKVALPKSAHSSAEDDRRRKAIVCPTGPIDCPAQLEQKSSRG